MSTDQQENLHNFDSINLEQGVDYTKYTVSVVDIVHKHLVEHVLDIFYLILKHKHITKREIQEAIYKSDGGVGECPPQKYKTLIESAISKLEGAMLITSKNDVTQGRPQIYYLSAFGDIASGYLHHYIANYPDIAKTTKILINEG